MRFRDRTDAGRQLAAELVRHRYDRPVVLALPRGGVPVGAEVAARLGAPLDVLVVRKLGCPGQPEFGIGAITEGGVRVLNRRAITALGITGAQLDAVAAAEGAEVERRVARYRRQRPATPVRGRTAIVVDDGLATGFTARAAITTLRARGPRRIVLAVPVGPSDTVMELRELADEVVCLHTPDVFLALGQWYDDFAQVGDTEVADLLDSAAPTSDDRNGRPGSLVHDVRIPAGSVRLPGTLTVPASPVGSVIFAHGSGSSRLSPRNLAVGCALNAGGLATLLFDLLTPLEAADRANVFDIHLLSARLEHATRWLRAQPAIGMLPVGYFGASTGAAAALRAAARLGDEIAAVVSRGGRPDLAAGDLDAVTAPTLLVVGGRDTAVIDMNERALRELACSKRLAIVPGATHLFAEPGALEQVAELARAWFIAHLRDAGGHHHAGGQARRHHTHTR